MKLSCAEAIAATLYIVGHQVCVSAWRVNTSCTELVVLVVLLVLAVLLVEGGGAGTNRSFIVLVGFIRNSSRIWMVLCISVLCVCFVFHVSLLPPFIWLQAIPTAVVMHVSVFFGLFCSWLYRECSLVFVL